MQSQHVIPSAVPIVVCGRTGLIGHHSGHLRSDWLKLEPLALDNPRSPIPLTRWRLLPLSRSVESSPVIYMCRVNSVCMCACVESKSQNTFSILSNFIKRCAHYKRVRPGTFRRFRVARLWQSRCSGTSVGRVLEVALSGPSPSVVVDDGAAFVDLEYGLEFAVDDHVHGLRKRRRKVYLDAEITLSNQVEATAIAGVGCQIETEEGVAVTEVKKKVWFYIALYPVHLTAQSALHFPPLADLFIPTPFSASLGSILAMQQLRNDYSLRFPPLSIARYSFKQLSRLRRREVKENAQTSKRYQRGFEPGLSRLRVRHSTTEPSRSNRHASTRCLHPGRVYRWRRTG